MKNDRLTREMAERAAEIARLMALLDSQSDGASQEWIAAVRWAIRDAEDRLLSLRAGDGEGHAERTSPIKLHHAG